MWWQVISLTARQTSLFRGCFTSRIHKFNWILHDSQCPSSGIWLPRVTPTLLFHQAFSPKTPWTSFLLTESSSTGASSGHGAFFARPQFFLNMLGVILRTKSPWGSSQRSWWANWVMSLANRSWRTGWLSCPTENYESKWEASPDRGGNLKTFETTT